MVHGRNFSNTTTSDDFNEQSSTRLAIICLYVMTITMAIPGMVGHILVIAAIVYSKTMHTVHYIMIISLTLTDMLSLIARPFIVVLFFMFPNVTFPVQDFAPIPNVAFNAGTCHLILIAVYRYAAVIKPSWYWMLNRRFALEFLLALCWVIPVCVGIPIFTGDVQMTLIPEIFGFMYITECNTCGLTRIFLSINTSLTVATTIFFIVIYTVILMKIRRVRSAVQGYSSRTSRPSRLEVRIAIQFMIITFSYLLIILFFYCVKIMAEFGINSIVMPIVNNFFLLLYFSCNPFVYLYFDRAMQKSMLAVLLCKSQIPSISVVQLLRQAHTPPQLLSVKAGLRGVHLSHCQLQH